MGILLDAVTVGEGASVNSISFSHTCTGSDLAAIAAISYRKNVDTFIDDVLYNSVSFTAVPGGSTNDGGIYYTALLYLVAPTTGTNTFDVVFGGSAVFDAGVAILTLTGVDQSAPLGTAAIANGDSTTPSVTVSAATGDLIIDSLCIEHAGTLSVGAGQTSRVNNVAAAGFIKNAVSTEPGATSVTMSWSDTVGGQWALAAVPIKPKAAAGSGSVPVIQAQYRMRRAA
jgi:hypothetical protein